MIESSASTLTHLHIDGTYGISGDMTLGALVDLGVPIEEVERGLRGMPIGPFTLRAERVKRQGVMATRVHVEVEEDHHAHRHLRHVLEILDAAGLPPRAAARARAAFTRLAEAEARVHGTTIEKIHFHEVGQKDAMLDVAGAMLGLELLGIETVSAGPLSLGSGTIQCAHGVMPVPPPATAELVRGLAHGPGPVGGELATPTGVAILSALIEETRAARGGAGIDAAAVDATALVSERVGYGAGSRVHEGHANFLRLWLCQAPAAGASPGAGAALPVERHAVLLLETEIDDMSPELAGYLMERLLADGAYDVQFQPVQMKKNRPGLRVRVIAEPVREAALAERLFRETSTFGVRRQVLERWCLARRAESVATPLGDIAVKVGLWDGRVLKVTPEYESCRALAEAHGVPLAEVYECARAAIARDSKAPC